MAHDLPDDDDGVGFDFSPIIRNALRALDSPAVQRAVRLASSPTIDRTSQIVSGLVSRGILVPSRPGRTAIARPQSPPGPTTHQATRDAKSRSWKIQFEGSALRLPDELGINYCALLFQQPRQGISALTLHREGNRMCGRYDDPDEGEETDKRTDPCSIDAPSPDTSRSTVSGDHVDDMIDQEGIVDLTAHLATVGPDDAEQRAFIKKFIRKVTKGIKRTGDTASQGREARRFADENEKARQAISKALHRLRKRLAEGNSRHLALRSHIESHIHQGAILLYAPPEDSIWQISW